MTDKIAQALAAKLEEIWKVSEMTEWQPTEWQPIATAPKNGTKFIAFGNGPGFRECQFMCRWSYDETDRRGWMKQYPEQFAQPTHWMPLPEPPK